VTDVQPAPIEQPCTQIVHLAVPRSTAWQPQAAHQLIINLFALSGTIVLGIRAAEDTISWYIETQAKHTEAVVKAVYALYPQAQVRVRPKTASYVDYMLFDVHTAAPFVAPLKMADDFRQLDPLAALISTLTDLASDEVIVYELVLTEANATHYQLGEKLITRSTVNWWNFLHPQVAVMAATTKLIGADKVDKYVPEIQKPAQAKLNSHLKQVALEIKIKAATDERTGELLQTLFPTLAVYEQEGLNFLIAPYDKSFAPILTAGEVAALWHLPSDQCQTSGIVWSGAAVAPLPVQLRQQRSGLKLGRNTYQGRSHEVWLAEPDRVTHVNLVGKTGVGKSTLLHHMVHQDIEAGRGVAVIDPHGRLIDAILATSIPEDREQEVILFDTRDHDYPIGLNLLTHLPDVSEEATAGYALAVMKKLFADQWRSGRTETVLDAALRTLVGQPESTIQDIPRLLMDAKFRRQLLQQVTDPSTLDFWYDEYEPESRSQQREFARPITYRIRKFYRDRTIQRIVCQPRSLNFRQILDQGQIFLANLGGIPEPEAETVGALLISKIQLAAMSRSPLIDDHIPSYYLYIDEVQKFITTSLYTLFSEARKYGLSLVVANQFLKQLEGETLESLMGNVGTTISFRVGPQDARSLTPFVKPEFSPEDLINLDRFATAVKLQLEGETLTAFSMNTQPPLERPDKAEVAARIERIRQHSRASYARPKDEVDAELMRRYDRRELDGADEGEDSYFG
jgi:hypothetical protein